MWNIIKQWLAKKACCHDWKVHETVNVYDSQFEYPICTRQTLICKKCGKIKRIKL